MLTADFLRTFRPKSGTCLSGMGQASRDTPRVNRYWNSQASSWARCVTMGQLFPGHLLLSLRRHLYWFCCTIEAVAKTQEHGSIWGLLCAEWPFTGHRTPSPLIGAACSVDWRLLNAACGWILEIGVRMFVRGLARPLPIISWDCTT